MSVALRMLRHASGGVVESARAAPHVCPRRNAPHNRQRYRLLRDTVVPCIMRFHRFRIDAVLRWGSAERRILSHTNDKWRHLPYAQVSFESSSLVQAQVALIAGQREDSGLRSTFFLVTKKNVIDEHWRAAQRSGARVSASRARVGISGDGLPRRRQWRAFVAKRHRHPVFRTFTRFTSPPPPFADGARW